MYIIIIQLKKCICQVFCMIFTKLIKNCKIKIMRLEVKISKNIFILFLALNAYSYNDENNKNGMHPIRKKIRTIIKKYNYNQKCPYLKKIFKKTGIWYLIYVLLEKNGKIKKNSKSKISFILNLKKFAKEPFIENSWNVLKNYETKEIKKISPLFKKETKKIISFINKPIKDLKKIILIINPLDAYWRGYALKIKETGYIVVGPGAEKNHCELIRHELLHILAPSYNIPIKFTSPKDHQRAVKLGYTNRNIIQKEYIVHSLNLIYQSKILKKDIKQVIIQEKKYFPHLQKIIKIVKEQIEK